MKTYEYHYIIIGAGLAGMSLVTRMLKHSFFQNKKILILSKPTEQADNKTWCFWEEGKGFFDELLHHQWHQLTFTSTEFSKTESIQPFAYKMIKSEDFFAYTTAKATAAKQVDIVYDHVNTIDADAGMVTTKSSLYTASDYIFSSIRSQPWQAQLPTDNYLLLQHFKGWFIETEKPVFDASVATMMDFSVSQQHGTTFMYCLPTASNKALVEYTLFTKEVLPADAYEQALSEYIGKANFGKYTITQKEFGIIPMTNYIFPKQERKLVYIGTAGGATKASTGYTFYFVQKESERIINQLITGNSLHLTRTFLDKKYRLFDSTLLGILDKKNHLGASIFESLFQRNSIKTLLKFLNNDSTFIQDIGIMNSVDKSLFIPSAVRHINTFK
ncbi:MAG: lycopene cyclase [Bacteroidetes bacterium]|nr:MAG: lycopene cyclase [Bacteroidota bacterium]